MTTLRIYDLREGRVLALDLHDLIDLLAPRSLEASWMVSPVSVEYPTLGPAFDQFEMVPDRTGEDHLQTLAISGAPVNGMALSKYAHETRQVIWGQFVATLPEQTDVWVAIRAIDGTFYEVTTSDEEVLARVRSTYQDVRVAPGPVFSTPIMGLRCEGGEPYVARNINPVEVTGIFGNRDKAASRIDVTPRDVAFGSKTEVATLRWDVCFALVIGHCQALSATPKSVP